MFQSLFSNHGRSPGEIFGLTPWPTSRDYTDIARTFGMQLRSVNEIVPLHRR